MDTADRYKAAVELYASSIRALEQRSGAFLTMQSFLIAAYALLLTRNNSNFVVFLWAISVFGLVTCVMFLIAGRITSIDASVWRSYMRTIEGTESNELPWVYYDKKYRERALRLFGDKCRPAIGAADKLPGPTLWLGLPVVFLNVWVCSFIILSRGSNWWYIVPFVLFIAAGAYYLCGIQIKET
jgi:hypothetical protein